MASNFSLFSLLLCLLIVYSSASSRKLSALVPNPLVVLKYHNGILLKGNYSVNLIWYGKFTPVQRSVISDFFASLSSNSQTPSPPSVYSWWKTTEKYKSGSTNLILQMTEIIDETYSLGKSLKDSDIITLASKNNQANSINVVLTAKDVAVEGFCVSKCGTHGSTRGVKGVVLYAWVGNSEIQCPGQCAWPFHQPIYGPQTPPLIPPNGDVGVDGMVINLATVLAGTVTNPFNNGYYQGDSRAPLESVSACTGIFGKGAYPGYPGRLLIDESTGSSYNARGMNGRKYVLPAMWDPQTSDCTPNV